MPASQAEPPPGLAHRFLQLSLRQPAFVAVGAVLGLVLGLIVASAQPPVYEAEARLLVGTFEAPAVAIPGYVLASQTVAGDYARVAMSTSVVDPLAEQLDVTADVVRSRVEVTSVPESAVIRVTASSEDPAEAEAYAEGMSEALQSAVQELNTTTEGEALLDQHAQAAGELAAANVALDTAERSLGILLATAAPSPAAVAEARAAVERAQAAVYAADLRVDAIEDRYRETQQGTSTSSRIRALGGAEVRETSALLQQAAIVAVGVMIGLLAGLAAAWWRTRRPVASAGVAPTGDGGGAPPSGSPRRPAATAAPGGVDPADAAGTADPAPSQGPTQPPRRNGGGPRRQPVEGSA